MPTLLDEMKRCNTLNKCIEFALIDTYGKLEEVASWLICMENFFGHNKKVKVLGQEVTLVKFDLYNDVLVGVCKNKKDTARVTLDSLEFANPTAKEKMWLKAWDKYWKSSTSEY